MSDEKEDDDLPPERVTLFSVIDNKEGANLIKSIYFFIGVYCAFMLVGTAALMYFANKGSTIGSVIVAIWAFDRIEKFKLGRISNLTIEIYCFTAFPLVFIYFFPVLIFSPLLLLTLWGLRNLRKIKNNDNLVRELKSRADLYQQYREWLYAEK